MKIISFISPIIPLTFECDRYTVYGDYYAVFRNRWVPRDCEIHCIKPSKFFGFRVPEVYEVCTYHLCYELWQPGQRNIKKRGLKCVTFILQGILRVILYSKNHSRIRKYPRILLYSQCTAPVLPSFFVKATLLYCPVMLLTILGFFWTTTKAGMSFTYSVD